MSVFVESKYLLYVNFNVDVNLWPLQISKLIDQSLTYTRHLFSIGRNRYRERSAKNKVGNSRF